MKIKEYSFLKSLGNNTYDEIRSYANLIIPIVSLFLLILYTFSSFFYWEFISTLLNLCTGTSLLFIIYLVFIMHKLDTTIVIDIDEYNRSRFDSDFKEIETTKEYKFTIFWSILMIIIGFIAVVYTQDYKKHYAFKCETFLVDKTAGVFHLDGYYDDCEEKQEAKSLVKMKGYEIEEYGYSFCIGCEEWAEDAGMDYDLNSRVRK